MIDFRFPHSRKRIGDTLDFKLGKERMAEIKKRFGAQAERLNAHEIDPATAVPLFFKALELPLPKNEEDFTKRRRELFEPLKQNAESLVGKYKEELGANAYALFNALTDFASRPPVLPNFRRTQHSIQMQAGRWLSEFDTLLQKNPQPDIAKYLGEYGAVAQWN